MTQYLPPQLLALFAPRDPIPYLPPVDKLPYQKKTTGYSGVGKFLNEFEDPADTPAPVKVETREERILRKKEWKAEVAAYNLEQHLAVWKPDANKCATTDPKKTLFVGRINYFTSESKLKREFERYGPIKKIITVKNEQGKPRGYAFIEYERTHSMHDAYKHMDGKKIEGMRVVVDFERGRTIEGWRPRRLGGGLGGTRRGGPERNTKVSGRDDGDFRSRDRGTERDRGMDRDRGMERDNYRDERRDMDRDPAMMRDRTERRRSRSRERRRRSGSRNRERGDRGDRSHRRERGERSERKHRRSRSRDRKHRDRPRDRSDRDKERSERHMADTSETNSRDDRQDYVDNGDESHHDEDMRGDRDDRMMQDVVIKQEPDDMSDLDTDMRQI